MNNQNKKPLVSVVVTTYNQERTIAQTLDSILAQQCDFDMELVLGEDCSTDSTRAICERYAAQYPGIVRLMPAAPNKGLLHNYADCVAACRGKYLAVCAGDDYWNGTDSLARKVAFLEANPDYGVVHTDHDILHVAEGRLEKAHRKGRGQVLHSDENVFVELMGDNPSGIAALTMLVRLDLLRCHVDFYRCMELGFMMEDLPMWLELSQHTKFKYMDICSATYRLADGSACNNASNFAKSERFYANSLDVKLWFLNRYPHPEIDPNRLRNSFYRQMAYAAFTARNDEGLCKYARLWKPLSLKERVAKVVMHVPGLRGLYRRRLSQ